MVTIEETLKINFAALISFRCGEPIFDFLVLAEFEVGHRQPFLEVALRDAAVGTAHRRELLHQPTFILNWKSGAECVLDQQSQP